jgi:hypothetical protein
MSRPFFQSVRSIWLFVPIAFIPLFLPSGESHSWYEVGRGWPWHYGSQATDVRLVPMPSIVSSSAFVGDLLVGLAVALTLWMLVRYFCGKTRI